MDGFVRLAVIVLLLGAMFGFIFVMDRKSKAQAQTGKPSRLIRISAAAIGLAGIAMSLYLIGLGLGSPWFLIPLSLVLLAYGVFGLFGTVQPRTTDASDRDEGSS